MTESENRKVVDLSRKFLRRLAMAKLKKTCLLILVLVAAAGFLWAGGEQEGEEGSGKTVITMWKFGGPQHEREYILEQNELYMERNPGVTIEWSYQDYGTKREKVISGHSANQLPDIIALDGQSIPEFAEMGIIIPLDDIDAGLVSEWEENYPPEIWNTNMHEGKVYAVSTYVDATTFLAYNTKMFRDAGITGSDGDARPPEDWAEVVSIAEKMTKDGVFGMALPASGHNLDVNMLEGIAYRNGGRWLDDGEIVIDGPGFVDALDLYKDLVPAAPAGYMETNFRTAAEMFFQGKTSMVITESFAPILKAQFDVAPDFEYNLAPFPLRSSKSGRYDKASFLMTPTFAQMVTRMVKNKEAVMDFLDFWNTYEAQEGWSGSVIVGRIPTHKKSLSSETFAETYPDLAAEYEAGTLFEGALPQEGFPGLTECTQKLSVAMQEFLLTDATAQEVLDTARDECQTVYDNATGQ